MELDTRSNAVLKVVVEMYIDDAQPVSSGTIAKRLKVSAATIRSVMAELEAIGLLCQPHTSAGRVPTETGLRAYLDALNTRLRPHDKTRLEAATKTDLAGFPASLGHSLAGLSGQLAVVAVPRFLGSRVKEVGLVRHELRRFLAIFVSPGGLVQQKMVDVDFDLDADELQVAQNFLNEQLASQTVDELRESIRAELAGQRAAYDDLRRQILQIGVSALTGTPSTDWRLFIDGASHWVGQPDFADLEELRELLAAIEGRKALLDLLDRILDGSGVKVMLGSEHHVQSLPRVACVGGSWVAPGGDSAGVTLLGPSRMNYGRLVPVVEYATKLFERFWKRL